LKRKGKNNMAKTILTLFASIVIAQLFLNASWSVALVKFWKIKRAAGLLFLPYILWVSFAAVLNFAILRLNV